MRFLMRAKRDMHKKNRSEHNELYVGYLLFSATFSNPYFMKFIGMNTTLILLTFLHERLNYIFRCLLLNKFFLTIFNFWNTHRKEKL